MIRLAAARPLLAWRRSARLSRALVSGFYAGSLLLGWLLLAATSAPAQQSRTDNIDRLVQTDTPFTPVSQVYRKSHALLIGINRYKNRPKESWLEYAENDVAELKQMLIDHYGFEPENIKVLPGEQATLENIRRALAALSNPRRIEKEDRVLVFFAGHGQTVKLPDGTDMGFLIPYDADPLDASAPGDPTPYQSSCLAMEEVWTQLKSSPAKHVLLLADACYSGLLAKSRADVSPQLLSVWSRMPAMEVITGGSAGETTVELSTQHHGAFTHQLLEALKARAASPGQVYTATEIFSSLQSSVPNLVASLSGGSRTQTPQLGKYLGREGEFLFIPTGQAPAPVIPLPMPVAGDARAHLSVTSDPPGATVYVDGVAVGKTPLADWSKDLGAQDETKVKVVVVLDGYETRRYDAVLLKGGQLQPLSASLMRTAPLNSPGREGHVGGTALHLDAKYGMDLVEISAGEFTMGSTEAEVDALLASNSNYKREWFADEIPQRKVYLDTYYIGKTPVTVAQFKQFCAATGRVMPTAPSWGWKEDHPMGYVTWNDAVAYCQWLSQETGYRVTLPTEAQWEKAARGPDGRTYPWGNDWDGSKCANSVDSNNLHSTIPVGSYVSGASIYGVLDMAGNVWQWCSDWYDENYYRSSPRRNPTGPSSGQYRVLRGGSWGTNLAYGLRCAERFRLPPNYWDNCYGFRCVVRADTH
jgi:formylglycine-generating enzyme required for sulfatase activity